MAQTSNRGIPIPKIMGQSLPNQKIMEVCDLGNLQWLTKLKSWDGRWSVNQMEEPKLYMNLDFF